MPIRTNAYQFYKRCILLAQHIGQAGYTFFFFFIYLPLSQTFFQEETMAIVFIPIGFWWNI